MLFEYTRFLDAHTVQTVPKHVRMWHCFKTSTNGEEKLRSLSNRLSSRKKKVEQFSQFRLTSAKNTHKTDLD